MDPVRFAQVQELFHRVVDLPETDRAAYLARACEGDNALVRQVLALVEADRRRNSVLDRGVASAASVVIGPNTGDVPDHRFGPYRLIRPLGEGGMAVVYLARRDDLGSVAAIKSCAMPGCRRRDANGSPPSSARSRCSSTRPSRACTTPTCSPTARPGSSWSTSRACR